MSLREESLLNEGTYSLFLSQFIYPPKLRPEKMYRYIMVLISDGNL